MTNNYHKRFTKPVKFKARNYFYLLKNDLVFFKDKMQYHVEVTSFFLDMLYMPIKICCIWKTRKLIYKLHFVTDQVHLIFQLFHWPQRSFKFIFQVCMRTKIQRGALIGYCNPMQPIEVAQKVLKIQLSRRNWKYFIIEMILLLTEWTKDPSWKVKVINCRT